MKIVTHRNTNGGNIYASLHTDADTEVSIHTNKDEEHKSAVKIGYLNIFGTDDDLELLAAAISKHVRAKKRSRARNTL